MSDDDLDILEIMAKSRIAGGFGKRSDRLTLALVDEVRQLRAPSPSPSSAPRLDDEAFTDAVVRAHGQGQEEAWKDACEEAAQAIEQARAEHGVGLDASYFAALVRGVGKRFDSPAPSSPQGERERAALHEIERILAERFGDDLTPGTVSTSIRKVIRTALAASSPHYAEKGDAT